MKKLLLFLVVLFGFSSAKTQYVYKIKADSVLITNDSCTAELIIENGTKNVKGFLVNKGNGRTEFRRAQQLTDSSFIVAGDTILIRGTGMRDSAMWKNDGILTGNRVIQTGNYDLFFKLPTKTTESAPGLGHVYIGDSAYVSPWVVPPYNQDGQTNAALIISKKKNNNDENPDMLAMTTSDAGTKNGWLFQNYTNTVGFVCPRLYTFSNVTATGFSYGRSGYLHEAIAKSIVSQSPVITLRTSDYDSANNGKLSQKILHRTLYSFVNGVTPILVIDSSENVGINTTSPQAKLHIVGTTNGIQQLIQLPSTQSQATPITQIKNNSGDTLLEIRAQYSTDNTSTPFTNIFIGKNAGRNNSVSTASLNGCRVFAIGENSLQANTTGFNNTAIGASALQNNTVGHDNLAIGPKAVYSASTLSYLIGIGPNALDSIVSGFDAVAVGQFSQKNVLSSTENVSVGNNSLEDNGDGTSGGKIQSKNVSIGMFSGKNTNAILTQNVFIGHSAGRHIATAGQTVTGNVLIGYQAGYTINNISNRLYIANSSTTNPLIYGEFDNNILATPGKFGIRTKTPEQALHVVGQAKIDTITTSTNGTDSVLAVNNGLVKKVAFGYGTYTPTIINQTNMSGTTVYDCQYSRVGNIVTLSGRVLLGTLSSTGSSFDMSLPIASSFTQDYQLGGSGVNGMPVGFILSANTSNGRMNFVVVDYSGSGSGTSLWFTAQYQIL